MRGAAPAATIPQGAPPQEAPPQRWRRVAANPYVLLVVTMSLWAGNSTAARLATGNVPPMLLVALRWVVVCAILFALVRREVAANLPALRAHWVRIAVLAFGGLSGFNMAIYLAAYSTTALNLTLLQSTTPVLVLVGGVLLHGARISLAQVCGVALSMLAVGVVAAQGEVGRLRDLSFNGGDLLACGAALLNTSFTLGLRRRPAMPALVFLAGMAFAALLEAIPPALAEWAAGRSYLPTPAGWLVLAYAALGPSLLAQVTYLRGVEIIGPSRAGLFNNLVPVFGALFAVAIIGETFAPYHGLALLLALAGIYLAERGRDRRPPRR